MAFEYRYADAAELGVADRLGDSTVTVAALANATKTKAGRFDGSSASFPPIGIFEEISPDGFSNTELSSVLRGDHPQSVRPHLEAIIEMGAKSLVVS